MKILGIVKAAAAIWLLAVVATTQHIPGTPDAGAPPADDCTVKIETEGAPPPGVHLPTPQQLCDALHKAEHDAGQR